MRESSFFMFKVVNLICLIKYVFNMSNIIDSIKVSGVTYEIQGSGGGGVPESAFTAYTASTNARIAEDEEVTAAALNVLDEKIDNIDGTATVELTQAQYDALVTAGTVSADTYYIITDAQAGDLTNYYTKTETNTLLGGKADTATTYTKTETDNAITGATSTKQDTLVSGTNIKTINNTSILGSGNIDIQGGGGKAVTGGTNISVTTGETADTINCTLPISADIKGIYTTSIYPFEGSAFKSGNVVFGANNKIKKYGSSTECYYNLMFGEDNSLGNNEYTGDLRCNLVGGQANTVYGSAYYSTVLGYSNKINNSYQTVFGKYNVSSSGSTTADKSLFSVGNGTGDNARHNALEIRQNGDIYLNNGTSDVKLQDYLQIKAVQITQSEYDQLQTKDPNTLYVIVN